MTSVNQQIPNLIAGINVQPDELKTPGQVRDAKNCLPSVLRTRAVRTCLYSSHQTRACEGMLLCAHRICCDSRCGSSPLRGQHFGNDDGGCPPVGPPPHRLPPPPPPSLPPRSSSPPSAPLAALLLLSIPPRTSPPPSLPPHDGRPRLWSSLRWPSSFCAEGTPSESSCCRSRVVTPLGSRTCRGLI